MTGVFVDGKWQTMIMAYIRIRHGYDTLYVIHRNVRDVTLLGVCRTSGLMLALPARARIHALLPVDL